MEEVLEMEKYIKRSKKNEDRVVRGKMAVEIAAGRATGRSVSNDKKRCIYSRSINCEEITLAFQGRLESEKKHGNCSQGRKRNDINKQLSGEEERKGCHRSKVTQRAKRMQTSTEPPQVFWVKRQTGQEVSVP